jgi:hypothetical protein
MKWLRSPTMKVENGTTQAVVSMPHVEVPVIKVDEIRSILNLGLKGDLPLRETGSSHAVDTYA